MKTVQHQKTQRNKKHSETTWHHSQAFLANARTDYKRFETNAVQILPFNISHVTKQRNYNKIYFFFVVEKKNAKKRNINYISACENKQKCETKLN